MIEVVDVCKRMDGQEVLRGVSLVAPAGQITAVIGPSGGGKSVLLRHLLGLERPDSGRVFVDGEDVARLGPRALGRLRRRYGVVFQRGALFDSLDVWDNVAFPLRERTNLDEPTITARVSARIREVGLGGSEHKLPGELSGGMQRRAALARALVGDPAYAFFDEPTTGLDPILLHAMQDLIGAAQRRLGYTALLVSHDVPEVFDVAARVAFLDGGVVSVTGTADEVRRSTYPPLRRFLDGARGPEGDLA